MITTAMLHVTSHMSCIFFLLRHTTLSYLVFVFMAIMLFSHM